MPCRHINDAEAAQQIGDFALVGDDLRHIRQPRQFLRRSRRIAAHHDDPGVGIFAGQSPNRCRLLLSPSAVTVQVFTTHKSAGFTVVRIAIARAQKPFANQFGFVLVDFAAERRVF